MRKATKAQKGLLHAVLKRVAVLILLCFGVRFLSHLGVGEALDSLLREIGENSNLAHEVIAYELGGLPKPDSIAVPDAVNVISAEALPETSVSPSYEIKEESTPASESVSPGITAVIAENVPLPTPAQTFEAPANSMEIINYTSYEIDVESFLNDMPDIELHSSETQILIIHTHGSEAYSESTGSRTLDKSANVIRVGDALHDELENLGFMVVHDREIYDYPSYSGSYGRSLDAVYNWLEEYPSIQIVIDLHRDSITNADGSKYRTEYSSGDLVSSKLMLLISTGEAGLEHPNWQENLKFGLRLQKSMDDAYSGLTRPLCISTERYNQHAAPGYIILEVGTDGNSLSEAVNAARLFAVAAEPVIKEFFVD